MDSYEIQHLTGAASDSERTKLEVLRGACSARLEEYKKSQSAAALKDWQAAEAALKALISELEGRYSTKPATAALIENRMAAVNFLKDLGYKLQKSKLYNDEKAGLIKVNSDGTLSETEARAYAERYLKKIKSGVSDSGAMDKLYREKAEAELDGLLVKNKKLQFELEQIRKEWIRREDAETQIAVKLGAVDAQMKGTIRDRSMDWIYAIGGDPKKQDVMVDLMNADMDGMFNRLAELDEFELVVRLPDALVSGEEIDG